MKTCNNCTVKENGQIIYWDSQGNCIDCGRSKEFYMVDSSMKNNWKEKFEIEFGIHFKSSGELQFALCFIESLLAEQKKELLKEERQFILNILDGIDIADKQIGVIGGTQAIRQALQSRVI